MLPQVPTIPDSIKPILAIIKPKEQEPSKQESLYTIKDGDSLTKIAEEQKTTVLRLWQKNTDLTDPNLIESNKQLNIPLENESLPDRALPVPKPAAEPVRSPQSASNPASAPAIISRVAIPGNPYSAGNCTWYAKDQRPDMPNNLGNADTWFSNAANQGMAVGYTPQVGAVAAAIDYMHVAIVTAVHDNMVEISEMNFIGYGKISSRTAPISEFRYIY